MDKLIITAEAKNIIIIAIAAVLLKVTLPELALLILTVAFVVVAENLAFAIWFVMAWRDWRNVIASEAKQSPSYQEIASGRVSIRARRTLALLDHRKLEDMQNMSMLS
jgi:membrane protein implicated in regulation of membrane protease activity